MSKRVIHSSTDVYKFSNSTEPNNVGVLIEKNDVELGILPNLVDWVNLDGDYLMELAYELQN